MNTNQETNNESNQCTTEEASKTNGDTGNEITTSPATVSSNQKESEAEKNINVISEQHASSERVIIEHMPQGSPQWLEARRGCITMSHAKDLITKGRKKGEPSQTRLSYLISVASEIITGVSADTFKSWEMEKGNLLEPQAREAYMELTGYDIQEVGLGYLNSERRISGSPDGLGIDRGMEVKCQQPKNHLKTIVNGFDPKEFRPQMQGNMWVFDKKYWDYVSWCPEFKDQPIFIYTVERDEEMIAEIRESALKGIKEIDAFVEKGLFKTSNDKIESIRQFSLEMIETFKNVEPEIF